MKRVFLFIAMFLIWTMLAWPFSPLKVQDLIAGAAVAGFVVFLLGEKSRKKGGYLDIKRYFWGLMYIPVLVYYMVLANLDVLYRVLHPKIPINPGIVKVRTQLTRPIARAILCNSITLTPGTLSVDIIGDTIYVHWINISEKTVATVTEKISGRFEAILKKVFE